MIATGRNYLSTQAWCGGYPTREWYSGDVWPSIEKSLADLPFEVDHKRVSRLLEQVG